MPALDAPSHGRIQSVDRALLPRGRLVLYVGEPAAVVLARDGYGYTALDGRERIEVSYRPLPLVIDPVAAIDPAVPLLHPALAGWTHIISDRSFCYGGPEAAFAAAHRISPSAIVAPHNFYSDS